MRLIVRIEAGNCPAAFRLVILAAVIALSLPARTFADEPAKEEEGIFFTAPGAKAPGAPKEDRERLAKLQVVTRDEKTGEPTFCRVNVVGADGSFYQPENNYLTPYALTGEWPKVGKGNRQGKGPFRYLGRFFYSWGEISLSVPPGEELTVEVWKGLEYRPQRKTVIVPKGEAGRIEFTLARPIPMDRQDYYSGDPHLHFAQGNDRDESLILDLMEAEEIHFGSILAYNEPAGPYNGVMKTLDSPQRSLGLPSLRSRGDYHIMSGQEYRSTTYGHLNLFLRDGLVLDGKKLNANDGPPYGLVGRETKKLGGYAFYAHGGYAQAIYADAVQGDIDGVELLQFGIYRGIELADWYNFLNIGYKFPAIGASDYPACRFLGDCRTYVYSKSKPDFKAWLEGCRKGASFVTTGPLLHLDVDGQKPGAVIDKTGKGPHQVRLRLDIHSEVADVDTVQIICNGQVIVEQHISLKRALVKGNTPNLATIAHDVLIEEPSWIAARAFSKTPAGNHDSEAHTNPVYVSIDGKAPYSQASLDKLVEKLDGQIAVHKKREFAEKADIVDYFERSRDILLKIRAAGGVPINGHPAEILKADLPALENPGARTHTEEELKAYLKPVPGKTPAEALKTFETVDGFTMQLVAAEPLVHSPVAAAFDEEGVLYVAEMIDYPYFPKKGDKPLGSVRRLEDTDGDGVFDKSTVFANELLWAAGIAPWKGGVFIASPPDIWYMKDTDGDGKADEKRKVFTGFGLKNQQAMLNNLQFGLDHQIYGATAGNGGTVRPGGKPDTPEVSVDGRDFRFDPVTETFEPITGTIQFGNTFDDWGNRFVCSESRPLLHPVLPQHYLARNPYLPVPEAIQNIAGGAVPIYRISPIERWRHVRSSRRIAHNERGANSAGASHHVVDAAAGVTVYRGDAFPGKYYGSVFVGDAQNNLVHRMVLKADGVTFQQTRGEPNTEFVRSSDNWFRPVNFVNAPDGTLYVLDMSREILESIHIPLDVLKFLDLTSGRNQGRIYRMAPKGFRAKPMPKLSKLSTVELVRLLEHPNGWHRDTAHRLLFERQDKSEVATLERMAAQSASKQGRVLALWSLEGLGELREPALLAALDDPSAPVREQAVQLAVRRLSVRGARTTRAIDEAVAALATDADPRVRFQVAFALGYTDGPEYLRLAEIARRDVGDRWIRTAVLSSAADKASALFDSLLGSKQFAEGADGRAMLGQLAFIAGARNPKGEFPILLRSSHLRALGPGDSLGMLVLTSLGDGLKQNGQYLPTISPESVDLSEKWLSSVMKKARDTASAQDAAESNRVAAVRLLGCADPEYSYDTLASLIGTQQPVSIQLAAVTALSGYPDLTVAAALIVRWKELTPEVRSAALRTLLSRENWTTTLLGAADTGDVSLAELDASQRAALLAHRNPEIQLLAKKMLGADAPSGRKEVLAKYQPALKLAGKSDIGAKIFERECMGCHRIGEKGFAIGPNLASSSFREPAAVMMHVLDPNQYVLPNYVQYVVVDKSGRSYTGLIAAQTATSITLKRDKDATDTILRSQIDEMVSTGKSLMPEEIEKKISPAEMADLLAFITTAQASEPVAEPRLDIGTEPGLVEPGR
ncbi:MAG: PVC-type heme-binding CxxCH protein [Planctomycetaceae bacterium]